MFRKRTRNLKTSKIVSIEEPLNKLRRNLAADLTWIDFLVGGLISVCVAFLLLNYKYQPIPALKVGDIGRNEIKAPQDLVIEDKVATQAARQEAIRNVGAVFDYDPNIVIFLEREDIRKPFATARELIESAKQGARNNRAARLNANQEQELITALDAALGGLYSEDLIRTFQRHGFSKPLEDQLVTIIQTAMSPGVVGNRELIQRHRESRIRLRNVVSGKEDELTNLSSTRDITQARGIIRQSRSSLNSLNAPSRKEAIHFLEELITPNIFYSSETEKRKQEAALNVSLILRQIKKGKSIVREGERVTEGSLLELDELKKLQQPRQMLLKLIGSLLLSMIFIYLIWHYLAYHQARHRKIRSVFLLTSGVLFLSLLIMRLFVLVADIIYERINLPAINDPTIFYFAIPFAFGAILIALLADVSIAILFSLLFSMLVGIFTLNVNLACYVLIGNLVAIYGIKQYKDRLAILKVGLLIGVVNVLISACLDFFTQLDANPPLLGIKTLCSLHNGIVSSMFASLLLPLLESLFKITTDIKLLELSNLNTPILRRMSVEAPGTYHHSIVMGSLAEAAAEAIRANPLLVRVGAYYHDIGKLKKPDYFVENQIFSQNKHEKLSPSMSSLVIARHVKDGLEMAREIGLMPRISDMIPQHHGTRLMTYFYEKAKAAAKGEEINEAEFRYPGPKPQTKEAAIMMIADSVEATSRTLSDPTPSQIQGMIRRIIDVIVSDGQLDDSDITIKDLNLIEQSMLNVLTGIFHHRIEYPGYDFSKSKEEFSTTTKQGLQ